MEEMEVLVRDSLVEITTVLLPGFGALDEHCNASSVSGSVGGRVCAL